MTPVEATPLRVLVVDDNVDNAELLAEMLRLWGHTVHVAHDGLAAVRIGAAEALDIVLLDIGLPGIDGYEVARRLRESAMPARIVALSGYGDTTHRQRADAAGFDHYVIKPVQAAALHALLGAGKTR